MKQGNLFDRPVRTARARRSDPATSVKAARATQSKLPGMQAWALRMVEKLPRSTVNEMAAYIDLRDPRRIGRRLSELERKGLIRAVGVRACRITGRPSQIYEVAS